MKYTVKRCPICGAPNICDDGSMDVKEICELCEKEMFKDEKPELKEKTKENESEDMICVTSIMSLVLIPILIFLYKANLTYFIIIFYITISILGVFLYTFINLKNKKKNKRRL